MNEKKVRIVLFSSLLLIGPAYFFLSKNYGLNTSFYFFSFSFYFKWIILTLSTLIFSLFFKRTRHLNSIWAVLTLLGWGYLMAEIAFHEFPLNIPYIFGISTEVISHLNNYFINRSYQYIPLVLLYVFLLKNNKEGKSESHYIHIGDISNKTRFLGRNEPDSWIGVCLRINTYLAIVLGISIFFSFCHNFGSVKVHNYSLIIPLILYALNNCFIEEALFRGLFLKVFKDSLGERAGNFLQALFFGLIHFPSLNMFNYILKVVIFTFLGWIWGRATLETRGIFCSWFLHVGIVIAIGLREIL